MADKPKDTECTEAMDWSNSDNSRFYERVSLSDFKQVATAGGLDTCCDLDLLQGHIKTATSILEVGAGYGRVLDYILDNDYKGKITAIERSEALCGILQSKYLPQVNVVQEDIVNFQLEEKFDLILWLWSGIADFSKIEQPQVLIKLASLLSDDGIFVIDTLSSTEMAIKAVCSDGKTQSLKFEQEVVNVYCPPINEVKKYIKYAGFSEASHLEYETSTGRKRVLHTLKKIKN